MAKTEPHPNWRGKKKSEPKEKPAKIPKDVWVSQSGPWRKNKREGR